MCIHRYIQRAWRCFSLPLPDLLTFWPSREGHVAAEASSTLLRCRVSSRRSWQCLSKMLDIKLPTWTGTKKPILTLTLYNPVGCGVFFYPIFKTTFGPLPHSWSLAIAGQSCNHGTRAFPPDWSRKPWSLAWCSWRWMQTSREWLPRSLMSGANKSLNKLHVTTVLLYHYIVFIFFVKIHEKLWRYFFLNTWRCQVCSTNRLPLWKEMLPDAAPVFDKSTEDGTAFRIYRCGTIEVRTMQDARWHFAPWKCGWENCLPNFDLRDNFLR